MIGNFEFGHGPRDLRLLQNVAAVAGMAHTPFVAAVAPKFFGCDDFTELPGLKDLSSILEGPQYIKWQAFRESEDARYVGLALPRFLLRLPYDETNNPVRGFDYQEEVSDSHHRYCWGNAAFFSANSVQKPKRFAGSREGKEAALNHRLGLQLPYVFIVSRLAHYLKVIQRENIGSWKERSDLENELNLWIRQYVSDMDNPMPGVRGRRPLRQAQVTVDEVPGEPGWYRVGLKVTPHFKYMGAYFTLSLVGKLEKQ